jgi:hypothetical protein
VRHVLSRILISAFETQLTTVRGIMLIPATVSIGLLVPATFPGCVSPGRTGGKNPRLCSNLLKRLRAHCWKAASAAEAWLGSGCGSMTPATHFSKAGSYLTLRLAFLSHIKNLWPGECDMVI